MPCLEGPRAGVNFVRQSDRGVMLNVRVCAGARKPGMAGLHGDAVKIRVRAPPVDGKANAELVEFLAGELGVPRGAVEIAAGATSRGKRVLVSGLSAAEVAARLGL